MLHSEVPQLWFSQEERDRFVKEGRARYITYHENQIIALQGDVCTTLAIIIEGVVSLQNLDDEGRLYTAQELRVGESCGATLLFGRNNCFPMQVVAKTRCTIFHLKRDLVLSLCEERREILTTLLALISDRAHMLGTTVNRLSTLSLRERLLSYLHTLADQQGSKSIVLPITKTELAQQLGCARTSVSRELARLQQEDILSLNRDRITLN